MPIRYSHDFFGAARIEIGPEEKVAHGQGSPFAYRKIRVHPIDGGEPAELTIFGDISGILVTEEPQP